MILNYIYTYIYIYIYIYILSYWLTHVNSKYLDFSQQHLDFSSPRSQSLSSSGHQFSIEFFLVLAGSPGQNPVKALAYQKHNMVNNV